MSVGPRPRYAVVVAVAGAVLTSPAAGDDRSADDDADLLEFIGSWEGDADWLELLEDAGSETLRNDGEENNDSNTGFGNGPENGADDDSDSEAEDRDGADR